jgi:hypothetical protein
MWLFISGVFRFEILGFEQVQGDFYKGICRDVEIGEFNAEALRFRSVYLFCLLPKRVRSASFVKLESWHSAR